MGGRCGAYVGKPKRDLAQRGKNSTKMDIKKIGWNSLGLIGLAQDREK
jgi:hypothetical protein